MTKFFVSLAIAAAIVCAGALTWKAQATPAAGAKQIATSAFSIRDVQNAACRGRGAHCPPGFVWNGHRCVLC